MQQTHNFAPSAVDCAERNPVIVQMTKAIKPEMHVCGFKAVSPYMAICVIRYVTYSIHYTDTYTKSVSLHAMGVYGRVKAQFHSILTLALDVGGGERSASRSGRFTHGVSPVPIEYDTGCGPHPV